MSPHRNSVGLGASIALLGALIGAASYAWRAALLALASGDTPTIVEALVAAGPAVGADLAILHACVLALLGLRVLLERRGVTGGRRLVWVSAVVAALLMLTYTCAVRLFDYACYYYGGTHIDQTVLRHAEGAALGLRPGSEMGLMCAAAAVVLAASLAVTYAVCRRIAHGTAARARPILASMAVSVAATLGGALALSPAVDDPEARVAEVSVFPELEVLRLLATPAIDPPPTDTELDPVIVDKLARLGRQLDPSRAYPLVQPDVFDRPFPFARTEAFEARPNIIIVFFESFSTALCSAYEACRQPGLTPHLEELARGGHVVEGFHNASTPTLPGIACSLSSYQLPSKPSSWNEDSNKNVLGLPEILGRFGYSSVFIQQVEHDYAETGALMANLGFAELQDDSDVSRVLREEPRSEWGYSDHQMFRYLQSQLERESFAEPFLVVMPTLDSHAPFKTAADSVPYGDGQSDLLNTVHSTDHAFGGFWDYLQRSRYHDNTIVIAVADHAMFPGTEYRRLREPDDLYRRFYDEVTLVIRNPTREMTGRSKVLSSQVDLAPTILHMLELNVLNHFEGQSIFGRRQAHPSVIAMNHELFFVSQVVDGERIDDLFELHDVRDACRDSTPDAADPALTRCDLLSYFEWKRSLQRANRVWPGQRSTPRPGRGAAPARVDEQPLAEWRAQLQAGDATARLLAAEAIGRRGPAALPAVPDVIAALRDETSAPLRAYAAEALGRIGPGAAAAVDALVSRLSDRDRFVRREAAAALGAIAPDRAEVRAALRRGVEDADAGVRCAAVQSWAGLQPDDPDAVRGLTALLDGGDAAVQIAAANALGRRGQAAAAAADPLIAALLKTSDMRVRAALAEALSRIGEAGVDALAQLLGDDDAAVRGISARVLGEIGAVARGHLPAALKLLADDELAVRLMAVRCVVRLDPEGATSAAALLPLLDAAEVAMRQEVLNELGHLGHHAAPAVPAACRLLADVATRRQAIVMLSLLGPLAVEAAGPLTELLTVEDTATRAAAAQALGRIGRGASAAVPALASLRDDRVEVRRATAVALGAIGVASPESRSALQQLSDDDDDEVRDAATLALRRLK